MNFSVDALRYAMVSPNQALLNSLTAGSAMTTPEKVKAVMGELIFPDAPADRPYLYGCMVLSFDGKLGFADQPEGTLISKCNSYDPHGAAADFWMLNVCRCYADAVVIGTGTLRARKDKLWYAEIHDPELLCARRELERQTALPLSLVVSIDGRDVPLEHPIFSMEPAPLILTSHAGAAYLAERMDRPVRIITSPERLPGEDSVIRVLAAGEEQADTRSLLRLLRLCGVAYVSVEAPGYLWALIRAGLLDEYFLNYSGVMAGGPVSLGSQSAFTPESHPHAALLSLGYTDGFIFTRQKLIYDEVDCKTEARRAK